MDVEEGEKIFLSLFFFQKMDGFNEVGKYLQSILESKIKLWKLTS